jgi:hypothetical protein
MVVLATVLTACGSAEGPSTRAELCDGYDALSDEMRDVNGLFDNAIFSAAGDLGRIAQRYDDNGTVQTAGEQLVQISDSDETSFDELMTAVVGIQGECGAPPLGWMFGD